MIKIEYIKEPLVEFGENFLCDDPKKGLQIGGFYSTTNYTHRSEIHYACIGTRKDVERVQDWIDKLKYPIEATKKVLLNEDVEIVNGEVIDNIEDEDKHIEIDEEIIKTYEYNKQLNPDFPGFNKNSIFKCEFLNSPSNNIDVKSTDIDKIIKSKASKIEKVDSIIKLYTDAYKLLEEYYETKPDVCFIVIPTNVKKKLGSIPFGKQHINFRRKLKANIIEKANSNIPIQLLLESTVKGNKAGKQDNSMIAWNFCVAQYYKTSSCIPWAVTNVDSDTIFIGISFHKVLNAENNKLRSSVAQAFNREGQGLIITGKQFEWDSRKTKVSAPHLTYLYAKELIKKVLETYIKINRTTPKRVVVHKTTAFWDDYINKEYAEANGIIDGANEIVANIEVDLVAIRSTKMKVLRNDGKYPVLRGTFMRLDDYNGILYTTGYVPYYRTFPGVHIPMGLKIELIGESTLRQIAQEILSLSKLNFNNCNYYNSLPITLLFSQKVGEIIQYLNPDSEPPNKYFYYM